MLLCWFRSERIDRMPEGLIPALAPTVSRVDSAKRGQLRPSGRTPPGSRRHFRQTDHLLSLVTCRLANTVDVSYENLRAADGPPRTIAGPLLLSVDFEDWHQLVRRRVGADDWARGRPGAAAPDAGAARTARRAGREGDVLRPRDGGARRIRTWSREVVAAGHEIACHGDEHLPVHSQTREEFAADLRAGGRDDRAASPAGRPLGYRAPAFSIDERCPWAYEVLAAEGFDYDASEHDSPRLRAARARSSGAGRTGSSSRTASCGSCRWRSGTPPGTACPSAVPRTGRRSRSRWSFAGCDEVGPMAGLYMHPYEFDPEAAQPGASGRHPGRGRLHPRRAASAAAQPRPAAGAARAARDRRTSPADSLW